MMREIFDFIRDAAAIRAGLVPDGSGDISKYKTQMEVVVEFQRDALSKAPKTVVSDNLVDGDSGQS